MNTNETRMEKLKSVKPSAKQRSIEINGKVFQFQTLAHGLNGKMSK